MAVPHVVLWLNRPLFARYFGLVSLFPNLPWGPGISLLFHFHAFGLGPVSANSYTWSAVRIWGAHWCYYFFCAVVCYSATNPGIAIMGCLSWLLCYNVHIVIIGFYFCIKVIHSMEHTVLQKKGNSSIVCVRRQATAHCCDSMHVWSRQSRNGPCAQLATKSVSYKRRAFSLTMRNSVMLLETREGNNAQWADMSTFIGHQLMITS